jgi:hypothetical protein
MDWLYLAVIENDRNWFGSADSKNPKIVYASPIYRLCAADVGQNKRIVSASTVSANQPMVEAYQMNCIG